MHPELEMIAPVVFAFVMLFSLWLGLTALENRPNSGVQARKGCREYLLRIL